MAKWSAMACLCCKTGRSDRERALLEEVAGDVIEVERRAAGEVDEFAPLWRARLLAAEGGNQLLTEGQQLASGGRWP